MIKREKILGGLFGQGIGDALGVPVEFKSRDWLANNPVSDYMGYMCWNQPPGTFSDDSSMMYCTVESLTEGYNLNDIANKFVRWYKEGYWGAHDKLFDIGGTTRRSLDRIYNGESPKFSGEFFAENNGNGSLMRILPLIFYLKEENNITLRYKKIKEVSSITHAHFRAVFSCFIFTELGRQILNGYNKRESYVRMQKVVKEFALNEEFNPKEIELFNNILEHDISTIPNKQISSNGYVLDSLESALYCFMRTNNYKDSVLQSVNLGGDTDTIAAINGGLAGMYYGIETIPKKWIEGLAKSQKILNLGEKFILNLKKKTP